MQAVTNLVRCLCISLCLALPSGLQAQRADESPPPSDLGLPSTDDGLPGTGPIRRADWFHQVWNQRRASFAAGAEADHNAVVFLGDSITQGWGDDFGGGWPGMKSANRGISGDTTRGMLLRLERDVLSLDPAGVVLLMGTNDLEEGAEPSMIADNFRLIVHSLKTHNANMPIVVCLVFPSSATKKRSANDIQRVNELYSSVVRGDSQVTVLDTWTVFADPQGDAKPDEFPDLLHPNAIGYAKWHAALRPVLDTLGLTNAERDFFVPEGGFQSLFNGRDLTGWGLKPSSPQDIKAAENWRKNSPEAPPWPIVKDPINLSGKTFSPDHRYVATRDRLVVTTPPEGRKIQQLWTTRDFPRDFVLKLEFRATPNADSGIFLRGKQLQCRDYLLAGPYQNLKHYKPLDWNEIEIRVRGTVAHCLCNGEVLEEAFAIPENGPIGLEGDRGQIEYRRIRIQEGNGLPESSPESQGVSSAAIETLIASLNEIEDMHSLVCMRHGHVIARAQWTPYRADDLHMLYSLSKSFTSTAVGIAIEEGRLRLDDVVSQFFPDDMPENPSHNLQAMRIRDLLTMSTGHHAEVLGQVDFRSQDNFTRAFLQMPVDHKPGTHFVYNTPASYMCSAIVQKVTGQNLLDYLTPRLFEPLGIHGPRWSRCSQGICHGGFGLQLTTDDIAKFGQLMLQKGKWHGSQLVSPSWIAAATTSQTSNGSNPKSDWEQGYGYQFWRCRNDAFRGDGAFGQYCLVLPKQDTVIAITSGVRDMQQVLDLVWDKLLPAFESTPLRENQDAHRKLGRYLEKLELPHPKGEFETQRGERILSQRFKIDDNSLGIQSITLSNEGDSTRLEFTDAKGNHVIQAGKGVWRRQWVTPIHLPDSRGIGPEVGLAASGAWTTANTFVATIYLYETPYCLTMTFEFEDTESSTKTPRVTVRSQYNVAFGPRELPDLVGIGQ